MKTTRSRWTKKKKRGSEVFRPVQTRDQGREQHSASVKGRFAGESQPRGSTTDSDDIIGGIIYSGPQQHLFTHSVTHSLTTNATFTSYKLSCHLQFHRVSFFRSFSSSLTSTSIHCLPSNCSRRTGASKLSAAPGNIKSQHPAPFIQVL